MWAALWGAVAGACIGSFVSTWVLRWGDGRGIGGRSACDGCGRTLSAIDLIPIISWTAARGRCRSCAAPINGFHPFAELAFAVTGGACLAAYPHLGGAALMLFAWMVLTLALFDARLFWLPHAISAAMALSGWMMGGVAMEALGMSASLTDRLIGGIGGFAALWLVGAAYRALRGRDGMGGGDAPMLGAIGAWTGWSPLPLILLFAALAGLSVAMVRMVMGGAGGHADWRVMRLPLGTLMALAVAPALWLMLNLAPAQ